MAALIQDLVALVCIGTACLTVFAQQNGQVPPVPIWQPTSTVLSAGSDRVFLSDDRHTIIVIVPVGSAKPDRIVRVPLFNDVRPSITTVIAAQGNGTFKYLFRLGNGLSAQDAIGAWSIIVPKDISDQTVISPQGQHRWGGSVSHAVIAQEVAVEPSPRGRYLAWFEQQETALIRPGGSLEGFGVETNLKPGFTTAWFSAGRLVEFDQSWPPGIFRELDKLENKKWREVYLAAIGPAFGQDASASDVCENFKTGIKAWLLAGLLQNTSSYVSRALMFLDNYSSVSTVPRRMGATPSTESEKTLARALLLSLQVESGAPMQ